MNVRIRPARPEDAAGVVAVQAEAAAERRTIVTLPEEVPTVEAEAERIRGWNVWTGTLFVAEDEGRIVGICGVMRGRRIATEHTAEVGVTVAASHRGRGVGRALMRTAEEWAEVVGIARMGLSVFTDNEPAIRLYRGLGYRDEGLRRGYYRIDGREIDEALMSKWL